MGLMMGKVAVVGRTGERERVGLEGTVATVAKVGKVT